MDYTPLAVIVGYLVIVTALGSVLASRTHSAKDWAVAGGGMGTLMIGVGIAGTRIGGAGTYGVAGNVIRDGAWYMWWYAICTFLAMALTAFLFALPYRRLQLQTVGEIFVRRFGEGRSSGRRCQIVTSLCVQTEYFIVNIIEAYMIAVILAGVTEYEPGKSWVPFELGVFIGAAILITYTALGGLWGSAATNLVHCIVILTGFLVVAVLGMRELGGWDAVQQNVQQNLATSGADQARWWSWIGGGWLAIIGLCFSTMIHTPAASVYVNFAAAARRESSVIPAFLLGGLIGGLMPLLAGWIGIQTLARYGSDSALSSYKNITQLATEISPWIGGLALAAVLAAVISSGGPILLSSATMFVNDWISAAREMTAETKLKAYRMTTVVYGLLAALCALYVADRGYSLLDMLLFGFAMVVPPAIAVGYLIYWRGTTEAGAFWGMIAGYGGGLVWFLLIQWALATGLDAPPESALWRRIAHWCFVHQGQGIDPSYITTILPLVVVPLISRGSDRDDQGAAAFYECIQ